MSLQPFADFSSTNVTPETTNFGLTRIGSGETFAKNGFAFTDLDRILLDNILLGLVNHSHSGAGRLTDPAATPGLSVSGTGGTLQAGATYYYRVALVDQWGLETAASPEASVTTPAMLSAPTAPAAAVQTPSTPTGNMLGPGTYQYVVTYIDGYGGETTASPITNATIPTGTNNQIMLTLPALPTGATGWKVYRSKPGQSSFYYLGQTTSAQYYDNGVVEDQSIIPPTQNTTNNTNSILVTIPGGAIPAGCFGWKIYRAETSGGYDGQSLVKYVLEGTTETSSDIVTQWNDTGGALQQGYPKNVTTTISGGNLIDLSLVQSQFPLSAMPRGAQNTTCHVTGTVTDSTVYKMTRTVQNIQPLKFTAYFLTPPGTAATPPVVRFRVIDSAATPNYIELVCSGPPATPTLPSGYYVLEYPLQLSGHFEAENGIRSTTNPVVIVTDPTASNGQAVNLANSSDYVQVDLGALTAGTYKADTVIKVTQYITQGATPTQDLTFSAIRTDTNAVLASVNYAMGTIQYPQSTAYVDYTGLTFTAPGGVDVVLRVQKTTAAAMYYDVDTINYNAQVPTLVAGDLTFKAFIDNGPTSAADVELDLWW